MAKKEVKPGTLCRIIGSAQGPKGSSVGRKCRAIGIIPGVPHTLWGPCWQIESVDGTPFEFMHEDGTTGFSMRVASAEDWLEVIDDDEDDTKQLEVEKELETTK